MRYLFLLVLAFGANAQTDTADLVGSLIDKSGRPLSQVVINLQGKNTKTNDQGSFTFEALPLGEYELDIEVSAHQHYNTSIRHQGTELTSNVDEVALDKLVVSANPLEHNQLKMTTPVSILDEEQLVMDRSLRIDQTLNSITGVNSGSFGAGSGQIVIRGQQGPRVKVLQNNTGLQDASSVSPDHWISTESLLAKQIEVLKGPATIL